MSANADTFIEGLDRRIAGIVDACTRCGKCAEVCPTPQLAGIEGVTNEALAAGVVDILKRGEGDEASVEWAQACCGSAFCIDACPEGINPRFMLTMARRALGERRDPGEVRDEGRASFQGMSRGVRLLSRLQLPPEALARLNPVARKEAPDTPPDVIFYTGCNLLKTPHIGLLCLDVLDKLGARYEVMGGPANCCGILQFRPGDTLNAGRQLGTTLDRFTATGAAEVLAWCPTCHIQFGEVALPSIAPDGAAPFDMNIWPVYLASRLDELKPMMTRTVARKVALCEFPGARGVTDAVTTLLKAVPGIELIDLKVPRAGYQLSSLNKIANGQERTVAGVFRAAEEAGVDAVVSIFHADHRELASHGSEWPFEIVNYMDLIGESLGIGRDDTFKRLKAMRDIDAIVKEQTDTIGAHGLDLDDMRDAIMKYMLGEQVLPLDRDKHPAS